jgi:hypothetical protein
MSLFKKPKKPVQLRLFSSELENMEIDENEKAEADAKPKKKDKKEKDKSSKTTKSSLLSFGDEGICGHERMTDDLIDLINSYIYLWTRQTHRLLTFNDFPFT